MVDTTPRGRQPASPEPATREPALPGAGLDAARMPGHWLLARLGKRVLREAHRLLGSSGRYGIHELCVVPDDIDLTLADQITTDVSDAVQVGARPLTVPGWRGLLTGAGFTVTAQTVVPMRLLEPGRLVAGEGIAGTVRIATRALRNPTARRRVLQMRRVFRRHRRHLAAVGLVATRGTAA